MVNQKGEFPMKARVSTRVHESTKRLLKQLPYTEAEVIKIGAMYLSDESNLLEWEIGELGVEIEKLKSQLHEKESFRKAKQNRLRMISPKKLDNDTLYGMLTEAAEDVANRIYDNYGMNSLNKLENPLAKSSIRSEGKDLGYNPDDFLVEVKNQLHIKCQSEVSDISKSDDNEMSDD